LFYIFNRNLTCSLPLGDDWSSSRFLAYFSGMVEELEKKVYCMYLVSRQKDGGVK
jgi:hypothetical protein